VFHRNCGLYARNQGAQLVLGDVSLNQAKGPWRGFYCDNVPARKREGQVGSYIGAHVYDRAGPCPGQKRIDRGSFVAAVNIEVVTDHVADVRCPDGATPFEADSESLFLEPERCQSPLIAFAEHCVQVSGDSFDVATAVQQDPSVFPQNSRQSTRNAPQWLHRSDD